MYYFLKLVMLYIFINLKYNALQYYSVYSPIVCKYH